MTMDCFARFAPAQGDKYAKQCGDLTLKLLKKKLRKLRLDDRTPRVLVNKYPIKRENITNIRYIIYTVYYIPKCFVKYP